MKFKKRFEKVIGTKIGKWTVLDKEPTRKSNNYYIFCLCECGREKAINFYSLMSGDSAGCQKCRKPSVLGFTEWQKKNGPPAAKPLGVAAFNQLWHSYRHAAKQKNLEFDLTKEQMIVITKQNCHYCGTSPQTVMGGKKFNGDYIYNGIDRKDNSKGYILENCLPCCHDCNFLKKDRSYEGFLLLIFKIYEHTKTALL